MWPVSVNCFCHHIDVTFIWKMCSLKTCKDNTCVCHSLWKWDFTCRAHFSAECCFLGLSVKAFCHQLFLTPSLPWCHLKWQIKVKFETLEPFPFFFTLAGKRSFIETDSIESRCVTGLENILFEGTSVHFAAWTFFTCWGSEGVNSSF